MGACLKLSIFLMLFLQAPLCWAQNWHELSLNQRFEFEEIQKYLFVLGERTEALSVLGIQKHEIEDDPSFDFQIFPPLEAFKSRAYLVEQQIQNFQLNQQSWRKLQRQFPNHTAKELIKFSKLLLQQKIALYRFPVFSDAAFFPGWSEEDLQWLEGFIQQQFVRPDAAISWVDFQNLDFTSRPKPHDYADFLYFGSHDPRALTPAELRLHFEEIDKKLQTLFPDLPIDQWDYRKSIALRVLESTESRSFENIIQKLAALGNVNALQVNNILWLNHTYSDQLPLSFDLVELYLALSQGETDDYELQSFLDEIDELVFFSGSFSPEQQVQYRKALQLILDKKNISPEIFEAAAEDPELLAILGARLLPQLSPVESSRLLSFQITEMSESEIYWMIRKVYPSAERFEYFKSWSSPLSLRDEEQRNTWVSNFLFDAIFQEDQIELELTRQMITHGLVGDSENRLLEVQTARQQMREFLLQQDSEGGFFLTNWLANWISVYVLPHPDFLKDEVTRFQNENLRIAALENFRQRILGLQNEKLSDEEKSIQLAQIRDELDAQINDAAGKPKTDYHSPAVWLVHFTKGLRNQSPEQLALIGAGSFVIYYAFKGASGMRVMGWLTAGFAIDTGLRLTTAYHFDEANSQFLELDLSKGVSSPIGRISAESLQVAFSTLKKVFAPLFPEQRLEGFYQAGQITAPFFAGVLGWKTAHWSGGKTFSLLMRQNRLTLQNQHLHRQLAALEVELEALTKIRFQLEAKRVSLVPGSQAMRQVDDQILKLNQVMQQIELGSFALRQGAKSFYLNRLGQAAWGFGRRLFFMPQSIQLKNISRNLKRNIQNLSRNYNERIPQKQAQIEVNLRKMHQLDRQLGSQNTAAIRNELKALTQQIHRKSRAIKSLQRAIEAKDLVLTQEHTRSLLGLFNLSFEHSQNILRQLRSLETQRGLSKQVATYRYLWSESVQSALDLQAIQRQLQLLALKDSMTADLEMLLKQVHTLRSRFRGLEPEITSGLHVIKSTDLHRAPVMSISSTMERLQSSSFVGTKAITNEGLSQWLSRHAAQELSEELRPRVLPEGSWKKVLWHEHEVYVQEGAWIYIGRRLGDRLRITHRLPLLAD